MLMNWEFDMMSPPNHLFISTLFLPKDQWINTIQIMGFFFKQHVSETKRLPQLVKQHNNTTCEVDRTQQKQPRPGPTEPPDCRGHTNDSMTVRERFERLLWCGGVCEWGSSLMQRNMSFFLNEIISCSFVFRGPPIGNMKGRLRNYVFWYWILLKKYTTW